MIITTRFPHDAASRYAKEADFQEFASRLHVYGIDFRDIAMVREFCCEIKQKFARMDVIINNAAQTVRKPPQFYRHLIDCESKPVSVDILEAMHIVDVFKLGTNSYKFVENGKDNCDESNNSLGFAATNSVQPLAHVNTSAAYSQLSLIASDKEANESLFPVGRYDRDDQQVDLRNENSWLLELGQVSTVEMLECHVINVFTPWVIISELKSLMESTKQLPNATIGDEGCDRYIVNVSAMEGQFYRPKTTFHPHSNMAKAALNMMTRTAAAGFAELSIFMTAVDTGWITDENPVDQWHKRDNAPPPLDEWDAAMRVLDPVLTGIDGQEKVWGVFLKNYFPTRW